MFIWSVLTLTLKYFNIFENVHNPLLSTNFEMQNNHNSSKIFTSLFTTSLKYYTVFFFVKSIVFESPKLSCESIVHVLFFFEWVL